MLHIWAWMANCVWSVCTLTPVLHPYNPFLILPCSDQLRAAHSTGQTAGPLISSFRADQWHWWQEPERRLWTKWGPNKTPFLNDGLEANNPLGEGVGRLVTWVGAEVEVSDWALREKGFQSPSVPAGGPAEQTAGNKAQLQHAETQSSSHAGLDSGQTRRDFKHWTAWGQWAAFFSGEKATSDQCVQQNGHTHAIEPTHMHRDGTRTSQFTHTHTQCAHINMYTPSQHKLHEFTQLQPRSHV